MYLALSVADEMQLGVDPDCFTGAQNSAWGVAIHHGADAQHIRSVEAEHSAAAADFVRQPIHAASVMLAMLGQDTAGPMAEIQPFLRDAVGRRHSFFHQGELQGIYDEQRFVADNLWPLGFSDSEQAFSVLLQRLRRLWLDAQASDEVLLAVVADFANRVKSLGPAAFVYSDGQNLLLHGDDQPESISFRVREFSSLTNALPILEQLGITVNAAETDSPVAIVVSECDLTADWEAVSAGEVILITEGRIVDRCRPLVLEGMN